MFRFYVTVSLCGLECPRIITGAVFRVLRINPCRFAVTYPPFTFYQDILGNFSLILFQLGPQQGCSYGCPEFAQSLYSVLTIAIASLMLTVVAYL